MWERAFIPSFRVDGLPRAWVSCQYCPWKATATVHPPPLANDANFFARSRCSGFLPSQHRSVSITAVGIYFDPLLLHEMHNFVLSHNNCNGATQLQSRQPGCQTNSLISGFPRTKLPSSYLALFTLSISLITAGKVYLWHIGRLYFPSEWHPPTPSIT